MTKQLILTITISILIAGAIFTPAFMLVRQIEQDHVALQQNQATIGQVVSFINQGIANAQKQNTATK